MLDAISNQVEVPESNDTIDIRSDGTKLHQAADGTLYVDTPSGPYELSVSRDGVVPTRTVMDTESMVEIQTAERQTDELNSGGVTTVTREIFD